ncbi:unnamed protein product [Rhizoctonia solani]|uniref:Uncharacterized protein n=1 Tax=Rhizoctonia solani TaxID=456999 RepID=A0A8H3CCP0_9AGAM|nr:unnamed protein product [Rhizoctonia solani]
MASISARVCAYSLVSFDEHDEAIFRLLAMPVTDQMIHYIACRLSAAVGTTGHHHLPTPPVTPIRGKFALNSAPCAPEWDFPPLETFLRDLVSCSRIHTASALGSMIYLKRITKGLQSGTIKHGPETPYRLAVALFTVASKYSHDIAPSTAHWAVYTAAALGIPSLAQSISRRCSSNSEISDEARRKLPDSRPFEPASLGYLFGPDATAALERDVLFLLDFNMRIDEEDLRHCLNALSSHERAEGPLEQLRLGQGRPELELGERCLPTENSAMRAVQTTSASGCPKKVPVTSHTIVPELQSVLLLSPPHTPTRGTLKRDYVMKRSFPAATNSKLNQRARPSLEVDIGPQCSRINSHFPSLCDYAQYPQLNPNMDVSYLSKLINGPSLKSLLAPIGVPSVPPPTPAAGIESLPFIYGGSVFTPALQQPALGNLIVAPDKDSPWSHGQVGEILRKTIAHQARQLAVLSEKEARDITVLNTPPPIPVFGSGTLYRENPSRSSVELARMAKLTVSDLRWYCALRRPVPPEMLDGELISEVKDELVKLGIPTPNRGQDGMHIDTTVRRGRPVVHASSPSSHIHPVLRAALDKRIYCHSRDRHYKAVVDSGPSGFLSTRWDKKLQAELEAKGLGECEEQFKTTAPLRLVKKKDNDTLETRHFEHPLQEENSAFGRGKESTMDESAQKHPDLLKFNSSSTSRRHHTVDRAARTQRLDAGVIFVPPPEVASNEQSQNVGWFSRLLGVSHGGH